MCLWRLDQSNTCDCRRGNGWAGGKIQLPPTHHKIQNKTSVRAHHSGPSSLLTAVDFNLSFSFRPLKITGIFRIKENKELTSSRYTQNYFVFNKVLVTAYNWQEEEVIEVTNTRECTTSQRNNIAFTFLQLV